MFKKILPALTLMFVLTLSFAFRPAPQQQKAVDGMFYTWADNAFTETGAAEFCEGGDFLCGIEIPLGASQDEINAALAYTGYNAISHTATVDVDVPDQEEDVTITVYKRDTE